MFPDAMTSAQALLHVSRASRDPFHGEPASRGSTSGPYLLSSPLRSGLAASRGPASGVVSHGAARCPAVLLPLPLRHVGLRLVSVRSLSPAFPSDPFAWCPTGSSPPVSGGLLSLCFGPAPLDSLPVGHLDLLRARSSCLVPAPVHLQRSCGISRPARESIQ